MPEREAKILEIIPRTYNVVSFRLEADSKIDYKAGQFLRVILNTSGELKRYLSISSSPTEKGYLEFTKKITESDFCRALKLLKPQDTVRIEYPFGNFTLREGAKKIAFLSGGIGITPIRSICKFSADKKLDIKIILLYANRTFEDIAFREDFEGMQKENPKLKVVHILSETKQGFSCLEGRINAGVIKEQVQDYAQRKFYLCGPPAMVEAMQKILLNELNLAKENIITENFKGY